MIKSQQSIGQQQSFLAQKMILNPLELLVYELQSKQLQSRKQSIETVDVIALAMDERQIVEELIPLLMKNLVQESNKEVKVAIVKSFKKLIGLLSRQRSFLKMLEITVDIAMVFDQPQIKSQAIQILNSVLFYEEQQQSPQHCLLQFPKVSSHFKNLFSQLAVISSTQPISTQKVAIQVSMYLIRYVFKHQQQVTDKSELKQLIDWLKKHFFEGKEKDFLGLKIISDTFHMIVEYWPQIHIRELRKIMDFVYEDEKENQKNIQEETQAQTVNSQVAIQTKQKAQKDPEITQTLVPNSPKLSNLCSKQLLSQTRSNFIPTIIQLSKRLTKQQAFAILSPLLSTEDPKIKLSLVKKTKQLFESFKQQDLTKLLNLYKSFSSQPQQVKKAIVQYIDVIPFQSEQQKNTIIIKYCKNTIQLKNILINALIKSSQKQKLGQVLSQSDYDVKTKTWVKLPDSILHQQHSYADILNSLLSQAKKNFRSKLSIVTNLITRMEDNARMLSVKKVQMASVFNIDYFLPVLVNYFGDRIALIRVNAAKLSALIFYHYNVNDQKTLDFFKKKFYALNSSWVERQNVLIMIKEYLQLARINLNDSHHSLNSYIKHKNEPLHALITQITKDSINGIPINPQSAQFQQQKLSIKNISLLAQQILTTYSI